MTFDLLWHGQICVPVAVAILEDCCMAFAKFAGERIVAHEPLSFVLLLCSLFPKLTF